MQSLVLFVVLGLVAFQVADASLAELREIEDVYRKLLASLRREKDGRPSERQNEPEQTYGSGYQPIPWPTPAPVIVIHVPGSRPLPIVGKPTSQSVDFSSNMYTSDKAVDGSSSTSLYPEGKCSTTAEQIQNPWWRVDLGGLHCIGKVTILNRGDCCSERLENAVVRAGTSSTPTDNEVCGSAVTFDQARPFGGTIQEICTKPLLSRFISVDIPGTATLQLCEVTVDELPMIQCLTAMGVSLSETFG